MAVAVVLVAHQEQQQSQHGQAGPGEVALWVLGGEPGAHTVARLDCHVEHRGDGKCPRKGQHVGQQDGELGEPDLCQRKRLDHAQ